jgi:hypothetical protein
MECCEYGTIFFWPNHFSETLLSKQEEKEEERRSALAIIFCHQN